MSEILKALAQRSSTRAYTKEKITQEQLDALVLAGLQAPTAANRQEIHITVVPDGHPLLAEIEAEKNAGAGVQNPPHNFYYEAPVVLILSGDRGFSWSPVDAGIAVENIALAAEGLGLGSVIIGCIRDAMRGAKKEHFAAALHFPEGYEYEVAIAVGCKAAAKAPHTFCEERNVTDLSQLFYEVRYTMKPGQREAFLAKIEEMGIAKASRSEAGNRRYEYAIPADEPDLLLLYEIWASKEQQKAHTETSHFQELGKLKEEYVEQTKIRVWVG